MKKRLLRVAKWVAYPLFYLFCLGIFGYLTFPFDQLKSRVIAEFDRMQQKSARRSRSGEPMRLEIGELDGYWLTGLEVTGARLTIPPKRTPRRASRIAGIGGANKDAEAQEPKASVLTIDRATARVRILPLLIGDVIIDFAAEAFGGELKGTVPYGTSGDVEVDFEGLQLIDVSPLQAVLQGVPLQGVAAGSLVLTPKEGKFSKADGKLMVSVDTVKLGKAGVGEDGKAKDVVEIQGVEVPSVVIGLITLEANAKDGVLTFDEFGAHGRDFELTGDGKVKLSESWERAQADLFLKFKFSDDYRSKSDAAASLLGKPGDKFPPAIEVAPRSPFKQAKTDDGYYRFHVSGPLGDIDFQPAGSDAPARGPRSRPKVSGNRTPLGKGRPSIKVRPPTRKPADDESDGDNGSARPPIPLPRPAPPPEQPPDDPSSAGTDAPGGDASSGEASTGGDGEAEGTDEGSAAGNEGDDGSDPK